MTFSKGLVVAISGTLVVLAGCTATTGEDVGGSESAQTLSDADQEALSRVEGCMARRLPPTEVVDGIGISARHEGALMRRDLGDVNAESERILGASLARALRARLVDYRAAHRLDDVEAARLAICATVRQGTTRDTGETATLFAYLFKAQGGEVNRVFTYGTTASAFVEVNLPSSGGWLWVDAELDPVRYTFTLRRWSAEPTTCDNDVGLGQCAWDGSVRYRCNRPGGASAPGVANSQWTECPTSGCSCWDPPKACDNDVPVGGCAWGGSTRYKCVFPAGESRAEIPGSQWARCDEANCQCTP